MEKDYASYRRHLRDRLLVSGVPFALWDGLVEYLVERRPMGHFLTAIASNNLMDACVRADPHNRAHLADVVLFLVNYAPAHCWGGEKQVAAWLASTEPVRPLYE